MIPFIDLKAQYAALEPAIRERINRVLAHGQYIMGPEVCELEEKLAAYVGVEHCVAASSGTDALLIAMMTLDVGPGDEVITSAFSFVAGCEMIALLGAKPVLVDIDPATWNIDPICIEAAITPKTKAILPVSLFGQCADMDRINVIAARHGLTVVEDAAQSFGSTYRGRKSCALSTIGVTSFFPSKPLGGYGDGGALFTNDGSIARTARQIRGHGQDRRYHHCRIGINGRLDTLQAAILLAKLERFDWEVEQRQKIGARYTALLSSRCPAVTTPHIEPHNTCVHAQYSVLVDDRDSAVSRLAAQEIPAAIHYPLPLNRQPAYASCCGRLTSPIADNVAMKIMSLPMHADLHPAIQDEIVSTLAVAIVPDQASSAMRS